MLYAYAFACISVARLTYIRLDKTIIDNSLCHTNYQFET
jgi:hypothetical protein